MIVYHESFWFIKFALDMLNHKIYMSEVFVTRGCMEFERRHEPTLGTALLAERYVARTNPRMKVNFVATL